MTLNLQHPTLEVIDSSKIQSYMGCPRKCFYQYIAGFNSGKNIHLVFGSSMHKLMEGLYKYGYNQKGIEAGFKDFLKEYRKTFSPESDLHNAPKNPEIALLAAVKYIERYKNDSFEVYQIEMGFKLDVDGNYIYGKMDAIIHPAEGYMIDEHKTTGWSLEGTWAAQWVLRTQCNVYLLALYTYLIQEGINPEEIFGLRINGILLKQLKSGPKIDFKRISVKRSPEKLQNFAVELSVWLDKIITATYNVQQGKDVRTNFPKTNSEVSCFSWNKTCEFYTICVTDQDPFYIADVNPAGFEIDYWDPRAQADEIKELKK